MLKKRKAQSILKAIPSIRVGVMGDLMLDRYVWGTASRISPEAPVPIVKVDRRTEAPGGAANVLRNLATLGAQPLAFGVVGMDDSGRDLLRLLKAQGVDTLGVIQDKDRATIEKTRVMAGTQQVVRVDVEDEKSITKKQHEDLLLSLRSVLKAKAIDALVLEDYGKGCLNEALCVEVLAECAKHDIPVALDPHPSNPLVLEGITLATPNRAEAFAMTGTYYRPGGLPLEQDQALAHVATQLHTLWKAKHLLITLGADGMALFTEDEDPLQIFTDAREVYDVSGAGDTVVAAFMLALLAGATAQESSAFANSAAGVVVGKVGTAPVTPEEILSRLDG